MSSDKTCSEFDCRECYPNVGDGGHCPGCGAVDCEDCSYCEGCDSYNRDGCDNCTRCDGCDGYNPDATCSLCEEQGKGILCLECCSKHASCASCEERFTQEDLCSDCGECYDCDEQNPCDTREERDEEARREREGEQESKERPEPLANCTCFNCEESRRLIAEKQRKEREEAQTAPLTEEERRVKFGSCCGRARCQHGYCTSTCNICKGAAAAALAEEEKPEEPKPYDQWRKCSCSCNWHGYDGAESCESALHAKRKTETGADYQSDSGPSIHRFRHDYLCPNQCCNHSACGVGCTGEVSEQCDKCKAFIAKGKEVQIKAAQIMAALENRDSATMSTVQSDSAEDNTEGENMSKGNNELEPGNFLVMKPGDPARNYGIAIYDTEEEAKNAAAQAANTAGKGSVFLVVTPVLRVSTPTPPADVQDLRKTQK